jgi:hypothetical protein
MNAKEPHEKSLGRSARTLRATSSHLHYWPSNCNQKTHPNGFELSEQQRQRSVAMEKLASRTLYHPASSLRSVEQAENLFCLEGTTSFN